MTRTLITSMAAGWYKKFIPLFEYTAKKYNPGCDVRVFDKDELFPAHNNKATGLLRFLVPTEYFKGYDYVYFTDVDFVFLPHIPNTVDYHINQLKRMDSFYVGHRGPIKGRYHGENTRIAGGAFLATQQWLKHTEAARQAMIYPAIGGVPMRAWDEICLYRMCKYAGMQTPKDKGCFQNGQRYNAKYRNLHLGDFKFRKRWKNTTKMQRRFFLDENLLKYIELTKDPQYIKLTKGAETEPMVALLFKNLKKHMERRADV